MKEVNDKQKSTVLGGLAWSFFERIVAQIVSVIITIALARILEPSHFGTISIVSVLISFLNVFVSSGFGSALVQKKKADSLDYNTAFFISMFVAIVLYVLLFFTSSVVSEFYGTSILKPVIRVMGLRLFIAAINNIQQAFIRSEMRFKAFFWATIAGTIISGVIGVCFAYYGYGVWALVIQYLLNALIDTIMLFVIGTWMPRIEFSFDRAKSIWTFGWKVLATELVYTVEDDIRSLIIGKKFGSADLAFYDQGKRYPALLVTNVIASIEKVLLPVFSKKQDNYNDLLESLRRTIKVGSYILAPCLVGFFAICPLFVKVVLTAKWIPCIPFIQIFCVSYLTRPLESSCHQALLAVGRSDIVLKCMIIINLTALLGVMIAVFYFESVILIAVFSLLVTVVSLIVFLYSTKTVLGYRLQDQINDIIPSILIALIMGGAVYVSSILLENAIKSLIIEIVGGVIVYYCLSVIFKPKGYLILVEYLKVFLKQGEKGRGRDLSA